MMPIEMWWWAEPLFYTGFLWLVIIGIIAGLIEAKTGEIGWPAILTLVIAVAPMVVCMASVVVWFVANILILIWR